MWAYLTVENITQAAILIVGVINAYLYSSYNPDSRKWAYVLGVLVQPCWVYTALDRQQWGLLALCPWFFYTGLRGIYLHFIKGRKEARAPSS